MNRKCKPFSPRLGLQGCIARECSFPSEDRVVSIATWASLTRSLKPAYEKSQGGSGKYTPAIAVLTVNLLLRSHIEVLSLFGVWIEVFVNGGHGGCRMSEGGKLTRTRAYILLILTSCETWSDHRSSKHTFTVIQNLCLCGKYLRAVSKCLLT
jgi:hypothetical protein